MNTAVSFTTPSLDQQARLINPFFEIRAERSAKIIWQFTLQFFIVLQALATQKVMTLEQSVQYALLGDAPDPARKLGLVSEEHETLPVVSGV